MDYEWYDAIDEIVWHFEETVGRLAQAHNMTGMAPSAGDEARRQLRQVAAGLSPRELLDEVEGLSKADVMEAAEGVAEVAVHEAEQRGSAHVTREDVASAIGKTPRYPFCRAS